ncbi:MAG: acylphosphatase [Hyphomonadaceae bacterium]|nr:acylphosphatase [Hyphomonadaceae bacterium]
MSGGGVRTVRVRIAGRVQGVGYRYWTERVAGELELSGWVRNRRDGTVEAVFSGAPDDVAQMLERCRDGPAAAQVTSVDVAHEALRPPPGFAMRPTA